MTLAQHNNPVAVKKRAHTKQKYHQPPGYHAQTVPLKHMHSAAKMRAITLDLHLAV